MCGSHSVQPPLQCNAMQFSAIVEYTFSAVLKMHNRAIVSAKVGIAWMEWIMYKSYTAQCTAAILLLPILCDDILLPFGPNFSPKFVPSCIKQLFGVSPVNCSKEDVGGPWAYMKVCFSLQLLNIFKTWRILNYKSVGKRVARLQGWKDALTYRCGDKFQTRWLSSPELGSEFAILI